MSFLFTWFDYVFLACSLSDNPGLPLVYKVWFWLEEEELDDRTQPPIGKKVPQETRQQASTLHVDDPINPAGNNLLDQQAYYIPNILAVVVPLGSH